MKFLTLFWLAAFAAAFLSAGETHAQPLAIDSLEQELRRIGASDSARLRLLLQLAFCLNNSAPERAEEYARLAVELAQKIGARRELARAYRYAGASLQMRSSYLQALAYYDSSRVVAESVGDSSAISAIWTNIGLLYEAQGDYPRALEYAFRALHIDEALNNKNYIANSLLNIGALYYRQKEYDTALQYFERSKKLEEAHTDHEILTEIHYGIGRVYKERGNFDKALQSFDSALGIAQRNSNNRLLADVKHDVGVVYLAKGDASSALLHFHKALAFRRQRGDKSGEAATLAAIGEAFLTSGTLAKAEEYCTASLHIADELDLKEIQMQVCRQMAEIYKRRERFDKALAYKERELACRDSLFNTERSKKIGRLEMRYQLEQKDAENQLLMRDRALQEAKQSRSQLLLVALSSVLLLSVGIVLMLWQFNNKQRRINTELQRQRIIVEEQAHKIESANAELQERNTLLLDANEELQSAYTQIRWQAESLREKNLALEQLNNEKNELVAIVAHDLKNPIAAIRGLSELASERAIEVAQLHDINAQISRTANRMLALVKNILDINYLESNAMQLNIIAFDIIPFIEAILCGFAEQAMVKNITLHFRSEKNADKTTNAHVQADEQAIAQIMENLVSNAIKFSPRGKNVFVRVQSGESVMRIEIEDEGPGISEEDMKKLFGKFARLSARPTGGEHSTGLGLSIVKKMVEAMNGKVWCESEVGKGSRFIVELPSVRLE